MFRKIFAVLVMCLVPAAAFGFDLMEEEDLSDIRAKAGPAVSIYFGQVLGQTDLSSEEIMESWNSMSAEDKALARDAVVDRVSSMSQEEKSQLLEQFKQSRQSMSQEERMAIREQRMAAFESMTPEEQQEARAFRQEFSQAMGMSRGGGPGFGGGRMGWKGNQ